MIIFVTIEDSLKNCFALKHLLITMKEKCRTYKHKTTSCNLQQPVTTLIDLVLLILTNESPSNRSHRSLVRS